jgi:voltage-gated potassium channel
MQNLIVKLAYFLESSELYSKYKGFFYSILEDSYSIRKKYFDFLMIFLVLSTIGILIFEVNHKPLEWLNIYEEVVIFVFIAEWLGRLWITSDIHSQIVQEYEKAELSNKTFSIKKTFRKIIKKKLEYIFSLVSIIDLLAILPYYRPLRIIRILMLFRLFKLLRYANSIKQFADVFVEKKFEFITLLIMFFMAISFGSTIIFIYEGNGTNPNINSFFDAVYWSIITISTVGFGDISPVTIEGKVATLFLVIGGLSVIAFFTSIVTTALETRLIALKEEKVITEANSIKDFVLICGYGQMGKILANEFIKINQKFIVIDANPDELVHANSQKISYIKGDASDPVLLSSLGINKGASSIIVLTNNDAVNLAIVLTVRSINPNIKIIARANNHTIKDKLKIAGADEIVFSNDIATLIAVEYIGQPIAFEAIDDILLSSEHAIIDEIEILSNSKLIGHKLEIIDFDDYNLTLLGIVQSQKDREFLFNPKINQYIINNQDILIVIGFKESVDEFKSNIIKAHSKHILKKGIAK